jgi:serine/threonine-protein kinase
VIQGHLNRDVPVLTELVSLPKTIDDVVRRGMAKSPKDRYKNCRELISAARQALAAPAPPNHATTPVPVAPGPRTNGAVGPRPAGYQPPRPAASTPPGGYQRPVPAGTHSSQAEPVRLRPPSPIGPNTFTSNESPGGNRWIVPVIVGLVAIGLIVAAIFFLTGGDNDGGGGGGQTPTTTRSIPSIQVGGGQGGDSSRTASEEPTGESPGSGG